MASSPEPWTAAQSAPAAGRATELSTWFEGSAVRLLQAAIFGVAFGFLLQKGGVAKYHVLVGQLLLVDFTVVKVMLSAIVVGMIGVTLMSRWGLIELQVKETVLAGNIFGGLIFGVGFGLIAYCPGTDAAAVGQGNFDAIIGILGMILGSYLFALSGRFSTGISSKGRLGPVTLPQLLRVPTWSFVVMFVPLLLALLAIVELIDAR